MYCLYINIYTHIFTFIHVHINTFYSIIHNLYTLQLSLSLFIKTPPKWQHGLLPNTGFLTGTDSLITSRLADRLGCPIGALRLLKQDTIEPKHDKVYIKWWTLIGYYTFVKQWCSLLQSTQDSFLNKKQKFQPKHLDLIIINIYI